MTSQTLLGLFDGYMSLSRDKLTSETKLGGTAVYFPPLTEEQQRNIASWTTCGVCGHKMFLLLQAYSPLPSMEAQPPQNGWNRMLYVFCCNSGSCARQPSSSWCVFSLQVNKEDAAALDDGNAEADDASELKAPLSKKELPTNTFPPCFLYIDEEPDKEVVVPTDLEREMAKMAEANARVDGNGIRDEDLEELEKYVDLKDKKSDYYYEKFRSRLARAPNQVLRYHQRLAVSSSPPSPPSAVAEGGKKEERPIFMNPEKVSRFLSIPPCASCGAVLVHELQLMPTALFYLHVGKYVNKKEQREQQPPQQHAAEGGGASVSATSFESSFSSATSSANNNHTNNNNLNLNLKSNGDEGVDYGTVTVYVCAKDCAMQEKQTTEDGLTMVLRREFVAVEEPPSLRDDRLEAEGEGGKRDLRKIIEDEESVEGEDN